MLHYTPRVYGNGVPVLKANIKEWKKYYRYLEGYSLGGKGSCALFREGKPYEFGYLHQPGARRAGTLIL